MLMSHDSDTHGRNSCYVILMALLRYNAALLSADMVVTTVRALLRVVSEMMSRCLFTSSFTLSLCRYASTRRAKYMRVCAYNVIRTAIVASASCRGHVDNVYGAPHTQHRAVRDKARMPFITLYCRTAASVVHAGAFIVSALYEAELRGGYQR